MQSFLIFRNRVVPHGFCSPFYYRLYIYLDMTLISSAVSSQRECVKLLILITLRHVFIVRSHRVTVRSEEFQDFRPKLTMTPPAAKRRRSVEHAESTRNINVVKGGLSIMCPAVSYW